MNLNDSPTVEQLRDLLRRHDDRAGHHVLWVRQDGEVLLTCLPSEHPYRVPTLERPDMRLCYETFELGMEYVGEEAAEDRWWTAELFGDMLRRWPEAARGQGLTLVPLSAVAPRGQPVGADEAARLRQTRDQLAARADCRRATVP